MANFYAAPINTYVRIYKKDARLRDRPLIVVIGWWSDTGWDTMEPVIANPDGPGVGNWRRFYGSDPWEMS